MISIVLYQCHYKIDKIFIMKVRSIVDASEDALHAIHIFIRGRCRNATLGEECGLFSSKGGVIVLGFGAWCETRFQN